MSYDNKYLARISSSANTLADVWYQYTNLNDEIETIEGAGYFNDAVITLDGDAQKLKVGNVISIRGSDDVDLLVVTSVTTNIEVTSFVNTGSFAQFVLIDGTRDLTGDWNISENDITLTSGDIVLTYGDIKLQDGSLELAAGDLLAKDITLTGAASSYSPTISLEFSGDSHPAFQIRSYTHDDISISFDAYYNSDVDFWQSSDAGSSFLIQKKNDLLSFKTRVVNVGGAISWIDAFDIDTSGDLTANWNIYCDGSIFFGKDSNYYAAMTGGGEPILRLDTSSYMTFNRSTNLLKFNINNDVSTTVEIGDAGQVLFRTATATLQIIDTGTIGATGSAWVEVKIGADTKYLRIWDTK